jgi:hypothetical protein
MSVSNLQKNLHLSWRAGFGPAATNLEEWSRLSPTANFHRLLKDAAGTPPYIDVADPDLKAMLMDNDEMEMLRKGKLSEEQKKQLRVQSTAALKTLNLAWLDQMIKSPQQLREKVSLFWHGHFATRVVNIFYQQQLLDCIRTKALDNFGDLLKAVSKSAAMINFLNNNQNRKGHPNENFAREVMELFTLGRGNYSENDIKEAARAFTGWGANLKGEFIFRANLHDEGEKTFLGKTGNFNGDDILNILLEQKQTARFITQKIYKYFVNTQVDANKIEWLAARFYQQQYSITGLLSDIFTSDWFYNEKNIGSKIKSPVELLVGIRRLLPMEIQNEEVQILMQRLLGQILFYPPNVAGWPGGKNWIDSSSLMMRLRIPQLIYAGDVFTQQPKDDDDQMMGMKDRLNRLKEPEGNNTIPNVGKKNNKFQKPGQQILASINWSEYLKAFETQPRSSLYAAIAGLVLQTKNWLPENILNNYIDAASRETYIKTTTIQLMRTPEYQLC